MGCKDRGRHTRGEDRMGKVRIGKGRIDRIVTTERIDTLAERIDTIDRFTGWIQ